MEGNITQDFRCEDNQTFFNSTWFDVWVNPRINLINHSFFVKTFKMKLDEQEGRMVDQEGTAIRVKGDFGSVDTVECLYPERKYLFWYFSPIVDMLVYKFGYVRGENLFGAAYDFRTIGDKRENEKYFEKLQQMIEKETQNLKKRAILISHGIGGPLVAHFLKGKSDAWKDEFIDSWYSISGSFGGYVNCIKAFTCGTNFSFPNIIPLTRMRELYKTFSTLYFALPSPLVFDDSYIFIKTESENYTSKDLRSLAETNDDVGISKIFPYIVDIFVEESPNVATVFAYGIGSDTPSCLKFSGNIFDTDPTVEFADGDGILLAESLSACKKWKEGSTKSFEILELPGANYMSTMGDWRLIEHLQKFISSRMDPAKE